MSIHDLNIDELQELLMQETKRFTAALHNGTPQYEKDRIRKEIDHIVQVIEERQNKNSSSSPQSAPRSFL
jgi:predicted RNase H-like nuclease (RuvC/YqgF family)